MKKNILLLLPFILWFQLSCLKKVPVSNSAIESFESIVKESAIRILKLEINNSKSTLRIPFLCKVKEIKKPHNEDGFMISRYFRESQVPLFPRSTPLGEEISLGATTVPLFVMGNRFETVLSEISDSLKNSNVMSDTSALMQLLSQNKIKNVEYLKAYNKIRVIENIGDSILVESYIDPSEILKAYAHTKKESGYSITVNDRVNSSISSLPNPIPTGRIKHGNIKYDFKNEWLNDKHMSTKSISISSNVEGENICFTFSIDNPNPGIRYAVIWIFDYQKKMILSNTPKYATYQNRQLAFWKKINTDDLDREIQIIIPRKEVLDNYQHFGNNHLILPVLGLFNSQGILVNKSPNNNFRIADPK